MLLFLGAMKQMAVLNLNDVVHVPCGLCFLPLPLVFQSAVINLSRSSRTLEGAAQLIRQRLRLDR